MNAEASEPGFILKQVRASGSTPEQLRLGFSREAYFGRLINALRPILETCARAEDAACHDGRQHLVRFVESFEVCLFCLKFSCALKIGKLAAT